MDHDALCTATKATGRQYWKSKTATTEAKQPNRSSWRT